MLLYESSGEFNQNPECFTGTEVRKLSLDEDEAWLSLVASSTKVVDQALVDRLNVDVEINQGGEAAREALALLEHWGNDTTFMPETKHEFQVRRKAKKHFHEELGTYREDSPLFPALDYVSKANLANLIANLRLVHSYVGDSLARVVGAKSNLLLRTTIGVRERMELAAADGLSVVNILLYNPDAFAHSHSGDNLVGFLRRVRKVHGAAIDHPEPDSSEEALRDDETLGGKATAAPHEWSTEAIVRSIALAGITYLDAELIRNTLSNLGAMGDEYEAFEQAVAELAESRDDIRPRDLLRILGSVASGR